MSRDFERWLKEPPRYLTFTQFARLSEKDRNLLQGAYEEQRKKEAERYARDEGHRKERLSKYMSKLRTREKRKA